VSESLDRRLLLAREAGDFEPLLASIPYYRFLGLRADVTQDELWVRMPPQERLVGNPTLPALHGGTIGALLESAAILTLLWQDDVQRVPKIISLTVDYLRSGALRESIACAVITRRGRRVANVQIAAWQEDRQRPIAAAHAHFLLGSPGLAA
jgi:uncharacterized protein (TIGR00369 family)